MKPFNLRILGLSITAASVVALAVALLAQYIGGLAPCELCLWQRWPYVIAAIAGLGVWLSRSRFIEVWFLCLALFVFLCGAAVALFHVGVEQQWWQGTNQCGTTLPKFASIEALREALRHAPVASCEHPGWTGLGISMAGYNFIVSILLAASVAFALLRSGAGSRK